MKINQTILVAVAMITIAGGCRTQEVRLVLPQREITVSMRADSYKQGESVVYGIDYGSTIPFGTPTVQVLSGTQVVLSEPVPQHYAVVRKVYQHGLPLTVDGKPLPPGSYGLRVGFGDRQTEAIPFTINR